MSVSDTMVVDGAGLNAESGRLELAIFDHLEWDDPDGHRQLVQDKINAYLDYVLDGQVAEQYPGVEAARDGWEIRVVAQYPVPETAYDFYVQLAEQLQQFACHLVVTDPGAERA